MMLAISPPSNNILCAKDVDIFTAKEKQEKVVFEYENSGNSDREEKQCKIKINDIHLTVHSNDDNENIIESLHYSQRVIHAKNFVMFFASDSVNYRNGKSPRLLKFETEKVAEKLMKIVWKFKNKKAGFNPSDTIFFRNKEASFCSISEKPPTTITHSNHDLAAVFSYEEKQASITVWTSKNSVAKCLCRIHIDVEKEIINIKNHESESFEVSFSQRISRNYDTLTFAMPSSNDNEKLKLTFNDKATGEKVDKIMEYVKAKKKAIKAEKMTLKIMLQKLVQEPSSFKSIKKILKYYATSFIIFKEEYRKIAIEIYQAYTFHNRILPSTSFSAEVLGVEIKQEISEISNSSLVRKRKHVKEIADIKLPIKILKKNEDEEIIWHPNFEFLCDDKGVPKKRLAIFASDDREKRYEFHPTFRPDFDSIQYSCIMCDKLRPSKHVSAKYCVNEFGESFIKVNGKHICTPRSFLKVKEYKFNAFERLIFKGYKEVIFPRNAKVIIRKTTNQWTKKLMIFTPSKNAYYDYKEYSNDGLYYCYECKEKDKYVFAKRLKVEKYKEAFEILDEDHICTPKEYKLPELIADDDNDESSGDEE